MLAAILAVSSLVSGCNKNPENTPITSEDASPFDTISETALLQGESTQTESTVTVSSESETTSTVTPQQTDSLTMPTSGVTSTTTSKAAEPPKTNTTSPKATDSPKTTPPATATTKATDPPKTEPTVPFDPQPYIDYAIEYGESIGLKYEPRLGGYRGEDNPIKYGNWNQPVGLYSDDPELTKHRIREHCDTLLKWDKANYFRPEVYHTSEVNWLGNGYLMFVFYARG